MKVKALNEHALLYNGVKNAVLESPNLTNKPKAPTQKERDSSELVANTEFVSKVEDKLNKRVDETNKRVSAVESEISDIKDELEELGELHPYVFKGTCYYDQLTDKGNEIGDVWNVIDEHDGVPAGTNYAWTGDEWDALGGSFDIDLGGYYNKEQVDSKIKDLEEEIGSLVEIPKSDWEAQEGEEGYIKNKPFGLVGGESSKYWTSNKEENANGWLTFSMNPYLPDPDKVDKNINKFKVIFNDSIIKYGELREISNGYEITDIDGDYNDGHYELNNETLGSFVITHIYEYNFTMGFAFRRSTCTYKTSEFPDWISDIELIPLTEKKLDSTFLPIVQETGDSETEMMSQKAVTDGLDSLYDELFKDIMNQVSPIDDKITETSRNINNRITAVNNDIVNRLNNEERRATNAENSIKEDLSNLRESIENIDTLPEGGNTGDVLTRVFEQGDDDLGTEDRWYARWETPKNYIYISCIWNTSDNTVKAADDYNQNSAWDLINHPEKIIIRLYKNSLGYNNLVSVIKPDSWLHTDRDGWDNVDFSCTFEYFNKLYYLTFGQYIGNTFGNSGKVTKLEFVTKDDVKNKYEVVYLDSASLDFSQYANTVTADEIEKHFIVWNNQVQAATIAIPNSSYVTDTDLIELNSGDCCEINVLHLEDRYYIRTAIYNS